jgi:iron complex outermembrane receptor protein
LLGTNLIADLEFGDLSIRSISAWEYNSRASDVDLDGGPYIALEADYGNRSWQLSQKINLVWDDGGAFTMEGGVFYLHEELNVDNTFRLAPRAAVLQGYEQLTDTGAIYFQTNYELSEFFNIEAGVRWNIETKDVNIESGPSAPGPPPFGISPVFRGTAQNDVSDNAVTGNITFNYEPVSDVLMYAKFTRGWKGPHINGGVIGATGAGGEDLLDPARPEEVLSVEFGWKMTYWDSRFRFNGAGFYYDYKNLQIFQLKNESGGVPVNTLLNAQDADVYGVELEVDVTPLQGFVPEAFENLRIFGSFAWLQSEYTDFKNFRINFIGSVQVPVTEDFSGNRLINSPEFSFAGYVQWLFGLGEMGQLGPRVDVSFKDKVYFNQNNFDELSQDALWLLNVRLDYIDPSGTMELAGWVRNVTDETYVGDAINLTNFSGKILYAIGDPRTYGATLTLRF